MASVPKEPKLRKKQVVVNELAQVMAELWASRTEFLKLENKRSSLEYELEAITQHVVNN